MKRLGWILAVLLLGLALPSGSSAGTYATTACSAFTSTFDLPEVTSSNIGKFTYTNTCGSSQTMSIKTKPAQSYTLNQWVRTELRAPGGSNFFGSTTLWYGIDAPNKGFVGNIAMTDGGGANAINFGPLMTGSLYMASVTIPSGQTRSTVSGSLRCNQANCVNPDMEVALYDIGVNVNDYSSPAAFIDGGNLFDAGTVSGSRQLLAIGADSQGGVKTLWVKVNGTTAWSKTTCPTPTHGLTPCPGFPHETATLNTAAAPFVEGDNSVSLCASDYAQSGGSNQMCTASRTVVVDN